MTTVSYRSLAELAMQRAEQFARLWFRREEDVLDCISTAWEFAQAGKGTPNSIAWYAVKRVRSHRQFPQTVKSIDTPFKREGKVEREAFNLDQIARTGGNPATIVGFRMDFREWRASLPEKYRAVIDALGSGVRTGELSELLGVTPGAVSQYRAMLAHSYYGFLSDDR